MNEYIISEIQACKIFTKVWAESYEDALEIKYGGGGDLNYDFPEPEEILHEFWNCYEDDASHLLATNGEYKQGYEHMKNYLEGRSHDA